METILLVDDEAEVLATVGEMLEENQYRILDAPNGEQALQTAGDYDGPIHLLLTDVVMPAMNGFDLAQQLGHQRPDMKILYMTGFAIVRGREEFYDESGLKPGAPLLIKPFSFERLTHKVRQVLDAKPPSRFSRPPDPWAHA